MVCLPNSVFFWIIATKTLETARLSHDPTVKIAGNSSDMLSIKKSYLPKQWSPSNALANVQQHYTILWQTYQVRFLLLTLWDPYLQPLPLRSWHSWMPCCLGCAKLHKRQVSPPTILRKKSISHFLPCHSPLHEKIWYPNNLLLINLAKNRSLCCKIRRFVQDL